MIRLSDPTRIGQALASVREMLGLSRRGVARSIAEETGRSETSVNSQIWTWDMGDQSKHGCAPDLASLGPYLRALDLDLAVVPKIENVARMRILLASIDNALTTGSHMTGANLAFDMLCEELDINRERLRFDPTWSRTISNV